MSNEHDILITNLQLFADGGAAAGTGTGDGGQAGSGLATAETGVTSDNPAVRYGVQREEALQVAAEETEEANVNDFEARKAAFDARRKGEDKDLFDAWANETIQRRMKGTKDIVDRYNEAQPLLETLARKYGVDYAVKKDRSGDNPRYLVFFKARDNDALTAAFQEYTAKQIQKEKKPSVIEKLRAFAAQISNPVHERTKEKELER